MMPRLPPLWKTDLSELRDGMAVALESSPAHTDLDAEGRRILADMLIAQYVGLRTMARARVADDTLRNAVRSVGVMLA
ncbi:MAG: hypothetical protein AAFU86_13590 [Pseudomonadota bacterium]